MLFRSVNTAVSMLPQFVDTGMQMLTSLLSGIIQSLPAVMEGAAQIIVTLDPVSYTHLAGGHRQRDEV